MKSENLVELALTIRAARSLIQLVSTAGLDIYQQFAIYSTDEDLTDEQLQSVIASRIASHQSFKDAIEDAKRNSA